MRRISTARWRSDLGVSDRWPAKGFRLWTKGAIVAALCLAGCGAALPPTIEGRASVIDGDTLEVHGQRVRLWGVDAPESRQSCRLGGRDVACGRIAANRLDQFLDGRPVACFEQDTDRYGRMVARCEVAGDDLGAWLVGQGLAVRYARYAGLAYRTEEAKARRAARGVWAGEFQLPEDWRKEQRRGRASAE
ncbi:MAG: nuclease [Brevundimonas sp.]|uniref:thermonuclease family protein n=1 Tax=Brevundimonas sp. TaxID=1871086 RepID=UPI000DB74126|nr:thermonuclease family protein [Brevundimonas sp.]MBN9464071.1 thermonuclease family protein [Brevundimonas sp.]PZU01501.1 MAG: nuclease [Brevundimonas sp.]